MIENSKKQSQMATKHFYMDCSWIKFSRICVIYTCKISVKKHTHKFLCVKDKKFALSTIYND